jgi:hypothetical protein
MLFGDSECEKMKWRRKKICPPSKRSGTKRKFDGFSDQEQAFNKNELESHASIS